MIRRPKTLLCLLAILCAAAASTADAETWTSFRGPNGRGQAADGLPPGDGPLGFARAWQRPLGSGYSGVSVAPGRLITAAAGETTDYVIALDPESGDELWRYDLGPTYAGHDGSHDGPIATPAIAENRVFMLGPWGHFVALDLETGSELWALHLVEDLGCTPPLYGFGSSPAVLGDSILLQIGGADGAVAAFDAATGELRWRAFPDDGEPGSQSPVVAELAGRPQVLVLGSQRAAGLAPEDGALLWDVAFDGEPGAMGAYTQSPVPIDDRRVLIKHADGEASLVEVTATVDGLAAQVVAAGRGLARSYSPPAVAGSGLYGYSARFLSALEPVGGDLLWRSREPGDGFLVAVGDQLAVVTKTGSLHLGAASREGWQEAARLDLFDDLAWTPPSYADGALYLRSLGEIARVDLVRGAGATAAGDEELPAALAGLAREVQQAADPAETIERFLAGRELPLIDGEQVVFLWHGAARDVAIAGDMIGMRREEPMRRLGETDLWWWATELDRRARISYLFFVDYQPAVDPSHDRRTESTVLGPDMNWFRGEPVAMSWFAMPDWPGLALVDRPAGPVDGATRTAGRLERFELTLQPETPAEGETPPPVTVPVAVWLPPGYDTSDTRYPVVYVHHRAAREAGAWPQTLDRTVGRTVAPLIAVFPQAPRMRGYGDLLAGQLVPAIDARFRTVADRASRAIVGMGWPGFQAALLAFEHSATFGALGVQSLFLLEGPMASLEGAIGEADASTLPMRIYLEWGRWDLISPHEEMNMRRSSRWAWELFHAKGWTPLGGEVWDSTDFASWRNRTDLLLGSLFPQQPTDGSLARWQTGR